MRFVIPRAGTPWRKEGSTSAVGGRCISRILIPTGSVACPLLRVRGSGSRVRGFGVQGFGVRCSGFGGRGFAGLGRRMAKGELSLSLSISLSLTHTHTRHMHTNTRARIHTESHTKSTCHHLGRQATFPRRTCWRSVCANMPCYL